MVTLNALSILTQILNQANAVTTLNKVCIVKDIILGWTKHGKGIGIAITGIAAFLQPQAHAKLIPKFAINSLQGLKELEIVATIIMIAMALIHNVMNSDFARAASQINIRSSWANAAIKTAIAILCYASPVNVCIIQT